ncbi:MAG: glutamate synthase subunit beta [Fimbriimonadaceae bacterium]|nr:glutamate synthase subunit beta [Fimbriimonadaceae bacterium]
MGKPTGFMEYDRQTATRRPVEERLHDWREVYHEPVLSVPEMQQQGARCMDCGIPFCHQGCPLGNLIPDFNDLVYRDQWRDASDRLHATNNFPEFTGRLCPAPCESSCVLGINNPAVTIKQIELAIIERAWAEGWIRPEPPATLTGKSVGVIGAGPAGLACAQQLRRAGHAVTVYERADQAGGLLRYGIPEFKMEKRHLDGRLAQMLAEGVEFQTGCHLGVDLAATELQARHDALVLCGGASAPRDLPIPGRQLQGIHFAVPFLTQANRRAVGLTVPDDESVLATDRHVVIIGGGDTGADCLGTSHRHGCASVVQFEIVPRPPDQRGHGNPWPQWDNVFRVSSAHEEGGERVYQINTKEFRGDATGQVRELVTVQVNMVFDNGRMTFQEIPGSERVYPADLVLLAMGFVGPERGGMVAELGVELDPRGNVKSDALRMTSVPGVFTAGDMTRGQSLIVWAIAEGRHAAHGVDTYLMGRSDLPLPLALGQDQRPFG